MPTKLLITKETMKKTPPFTIYITDGKTSLQFPAESYNEAILLQNDLYKQGHTSAKII